MIKKTILAIFTPKYLCWRIIKKRENKYVCTYDAQFCTPTRMKSWFERRKHKGDLFLTFLYEQSARWVNGAEIARWIASARMGPFATRSTASACARGAGPACTAIRSVFPTGMGRTAPRNAVAETVVGAITFPASVTVPPVIPDRCKYRSSRSFVVRQ